MTHPISALAPAHLDDPALQAESARISAPSPADGPAHRRLLFAASLGSVIEHYDFFCYAFIAPIAFGAAFFPKMDALAGTLAVYATFAVGFAARPLGGLVFGHYGDRVGRKVVLMLTLLIMGFASFLIGCLPSYASAGLWAPAMLVTLRFLQGFAFGGEYMNAVTLTLEGAPAGKRGLFASFVNASGPMGIIAASGLIALMTGAMGTSAFQDWGWRIPFLLSIVMVAIGTYVRSHVDESLLFRQVKARNEVARMPIVEVFRTCKKSTLLAVLINMVHSSFQYLCTVFVLGYAVRRLGMSASGVTLGTTLANVLEMLMVPALAIASDRIGRRPLLLLGIVLAAIWFPVFFHLVGSRDIVWLVLGLVVSIGVIHALMFAPEAAFTAELFPTAIRVTGGSLGKQLGIVLGGGCAPLVATGLMGAGTSFTPVIGYFEVIAVCAFIGILFAPENFRRAL
jgi:MFS transporter, MHS family, shikimate and dehydroshikimate transport protein